MTLIATLRAFAYGWSLHKQHRNAEDILTHSRKLVERLGTSGGRSRKSATRWR